jgi:hypothetical protein
MFCLVKHCWKITLPSVEAFFIAAFPAMKDYTSSLRPSRLCGKNLFCLQSSPTV